MTRSYRLKQLAISLRMFLLGKASFLIKWYYNQLWQPKENSLEAEIDQFSKSKNQIYFVQIGSNDGFQHDPLCKFIKRDNWQGLLIEPQQSAFEKLEYIYQSDDVKPLNKAVNEEDCQRKLYKLSFTDARWATGLSSFNRQQLETMIDSGHVARKCEKTGIEPPADRADYISYDMVECVSFDTLFDRHEVEQLDLVHIDTEGFDYQVLRMFPFDRFQPAFLIFEHSHLSDSDYGAAQDLLKAQGYTLRKYGADTLAKKAN